MRSALKLFVPALAATLTLAACGSSSSSSKSTSEATATPTTSAATSGEGGDVKTASNATLGTTVLVDARGMTLYRLSGEQNGKFICTSSPCTQVWHPLSASAETPTGGVGSLATVKRPDGTQQVTYKGMPLYTFAQDQAAGDAKGQGLKDVGTWMAVTVAATGGAVSTTTAKPAESSSSSSSGGGSKYGY
jgi:predicted lipoprotein with Yx(FWY)xxD motif